MPMYKAKFKVTSHHDIEIFEKATSGQKGNLQKKGEIRITPVSVAWKGPRERTWARVRLETFIKWLQDEGHAKRTRS